jgi:hypothetical protein
MLRLLITPNALWSPEWTLPWLYTLHSTLAVPLPLPAEHFISALNARINSHLSQVPSKLDFYNLVSDGINGTFSQSSISRVVCLLPRECIIPAVATDIPTQRSVGIQFVAMGTQKFSSIRCRGSMRSHCSCHVIRPRGVTLLFFHLTIIQHKYNTKC